MEMKSLEDFDFDFDFGGIGGMSFFQKKKMVNLSNGLSAENKCMEM